MSEIRDTLDWIASARLGTIAKILTCAGAFIAAAFLIDVNTGISRSWRISHATEVLRTLESTPVPADSRAMADSEKIRSQIRAELILALSLAGNQNRSANDNDLAWLSGWPYAVLAMWFGRLHQKGNLDAKSSAIGAGALWFICTLVTVMFIKEGSWATYLVWSPVGLLVVVMWIGIAAKKHRQEDKKATAALNDATSPEKPT